MPDLHIAGVAIDCADPSALAEFWKPALGYETRMENDGFFVMLGAPGTDHYLALQKVAEPKAGKNRVHLDLHTADRAAEVARLVALGASVVEENEVPGIAWTVLADPAGNEFCVAQPG